MRYENVEIEQRRNGEGMLIEIEIINMLALLALPIVLF